ncbi:MAG TPA: branched-chain amino acid transaminase [Pyrinomonadaceae bacterium]|nr:branched-chain amino acid transaminase [Pyrinomonadaceae bacterium]
MTFDQSRWVWKNGDLIPWQDATTHVSSHALHYGTGVFEGIRCYETEDGPAIFRLDAHLDRLYDSASIHGLEIPYDRNQLTEAICQLIVQHEFRSCYIRPLVYYGSSSLSLHPFNCPVEVAILAWPWAPYLGAVGLEEGVRVTVSPWKKFHSQMMPTTAKACGQYVNSVLAVREAVKRGFDEAILLNVDGSLAEGSGENLFLVRNGEVLTNDETHSILLGITRDAVIRIARDLGYQVSTVDLSLDDLRSADEAFFTGTAAEVTPIREVDNLPVNDGRPGPITLKLQQAFFDATLGRDQRYKHWLYLVESTQLSGVR